MNLDNHPAFQQDIENLARPALLLMLLDSMLDAKEHTPRMLEIGTIRTDSEEHHYGDGHSTLYLGRYAKEHNLEFIAVDIKIDVCQTVLERESLYDDVGLIEDDGLAFLRSQGPSWYDFIYLDGPNDAEYTMEMFKAAMATLSPSGIIALDDCGNIEDVAHKPDAEKGRILLPVLRKMGLPIRRLGKKIIVLGAEEYHAR